MLLHRKSFTPLLKPSLSNLLLSSRLFTEGGGEEKTDLTRTWAEFNRDYARKRFVDRARIRVHGGRGGAGCISFEVFGPNWQRPAGGHGGGGGNVVVVADPQKSTLQFQEHHFRAQSGANGGSKNATGRRGKDITISVPCGTVVRRVVRREELEVEEMEAAAAAEEARASRGKAGRKARRLEKQRMQEERPQTRKERQGRTLHGDSEVELVLEDEMRVSVEEDGDEQREHDEDLEDFDDEFDIEDDGDDGEEGEEDFDDDEREEEEEEEEGEWEEYEGDDNFGDDNGSDFELVELADLQWPGQQILVAKGG
jgi:GTPase involved in cell partitioning and DNA repair